MTFKDKNSIGKILGYAITCVTLAKTSPRKKGISICSVTILHTLKSSFDTKSNWANLYRLLVTKGYALSTQHYVLSTYKTYYFRSIEYQTLCLLPQFAVVIAQNCREKQMMDLL